jgi:hypothetical protein
MGPDQTVTIRSGPWGHEQVDAFLEQARIPVRLASVGTYPIVQSLWFLPDDGVLWCATQSDSVLAQRLRADSHCGFEISGDTPPYRGVRGTGQAILVREEAARVLPLLVQRYLGDGSSQLGDWLMSRLDNEVAIRVENLTVTSWDFSERMGAS